ncbi:MAG: hypothetical protein AB7V39_07875 [Nitrospiraceae bacterium]
MIPELLRHEITNFVFKNTPTRASLVGNLAKAAHKLGRPPTWMNAAVFDGRTWIELGIHERKYLLRIAVAEMLEDGRLVREELYLGRGKKQVRIKPGSILDRLATINREHA